LCKIGFENSHGCTQNAENGFSFDFEFLEHYHKDGNEFLSRIIRGNETWVLFVNVETKEQSKQWKHIYSPNKPKRFKQMSARKLMATAFWDKKGVLMGDFMQQGTTIASEVYCELLKNCIGCAIHNKRHGMLTYSVVLLHENARLHTAAHT
jgi:hypothetical protein